MKLDTLFDNYDLLMDSPNSTVKMRKLILQLAVQGKLVEQDSTDEPASELLKRIKAEKEKLIVEGKIKKQKPLQPITDDEISYELPQSWKWVRLDEVCSYIQRGKGPRYIDNSDFPVVSQKCIQWNGFQIEKARFIDPASLDKYAEERFLQTGDLLWNSTGTGTIGRLCVYNHGDNPYDKVVSDSHVTVVRPLIINSEYLFCFLASPVIQTGFEDRAFGTTNQIELATGTVKNQVIPIAPLMEQHRIVTKVNQLMHLCDQLDACQKKASTKYESLNDAALEKLLSAKTIEEFAEHWQFLCNNFDLIYNDPAHVNKLRRAILQLAVQGKLAPQDPNDEPASKLLKRIKAEKEKLLPPITEDEIPYKLPEGWEWVRLGEIGKTQTGSTPPTSKREYYGNDYAFIKPADISGKGVRYEGGVGLSKKGIEKGRFVKAYSVLMVCIGGSIGKVNFVDRDCSCNQQINAVTPYNDVDFCLVNYNLASPYFQNQVLTNAPSTTLPILSKGKWENIPFPLPPLAEQKRIVSKADQLMHLCDELENRLNQSKKDSEMLMQAVLYEAFS